MEMFKRLHYFYFHPQATYHDMDATELVCAIGTHVHCYRDSTQASLSWCRTFVKCLMFVCCG